MKFFFILLIFLYQKILSTILKNILGVSSFCRYKVSCSEFSKISIQKYGIIKGGWESVKRISSCHPFSKIYG